MARRGGGGGEGLFLCFIFYLAVAFRLLDMPSRGRRYRLFIPIHARLRFYRAESSVFPFLVDFHQFLPVRVSNPNSNNQRYQPKLGNQRHEP